MQTKTFTDPKEALAYLKTSSADTICVHFNPKTNSICWSVGSFKVIDKVPLANTSRYDAAWDAFRKMGLPDIEIREHIEKYTDIINPWN